MEIDRLFRIEAMKRCRSTEANRDSGTARVVQTPQPREVVGLASAVDALPYPFQYTGIHHRFEVAPAQVSQDLATARYSTLTIEDGLELRMHNSDRYGLTYLGVAGNDRPVDN
jgi:hypothetical protein